ncbi:MAG TPA: hypothetical protein VJU86_07530 [Pyrinomonadaceae bacterium]|nr:hypothetical protein [Pyrinomonadaceae bacterium]
MCRQLAKNSRELPIEFFVRLQQLWDVLKQNLTFSIRSFLKTPGFTLTGVLTLALGIGATTALFSVVYAVFEPMPYPKPDQLVMVWSQAQGNRSSVPLADFVEWKQRSSSFRRVEPLEALRHD